MLPGFLQSSYVRYKADTDTFATWLLETANKCGYQPTLSATIATTNKIASSSLTVLKPVLTIANRAIHLRETVTSWFLGRGDIANNKRHAHFITALEQICDTLEWKTAQPFRTDAKQSQSMPEKVVKVTVVEDENEAADSYLDHLFFKTLIDLMNAVLMTDSALHLARDMVKEVEADWLSTRPPARNDVQTLVYNLSMINRDVSAAPSTEVGLPYNKNMADVLLDAIANVLHDNHQPVFKKGYFGTYNPKADKERMSNKNVTLWLCFASQIFLDIHYIMRHNPLSAFGDLRMSGLRIQKEGDEEIRGISSTLDSWIIQDAFLNFRVLSGLKKTGSPPEKHALLSQHSILCGLILFHLNQLVTQWYDVQQLAFLHNLVISYATHEDVRWPDMDAFIKIHGESHIFIGSRPKNAVKPFINRMARNPRLLKPPTAVANLFSLKYFECLAEDVGIVNIDRILNELSQRSKLESSSCKELNRANAELSIAQKWSTTRNIDTLHLLAFLKTKLYGEEPVILHNYFGMHKRSIDLFREREHHKFVQYFTAGYMPDESFISNIVLLIHHVARGSAQNARSMGLGSGDVELVSRIVMSSGDVMREYLKKNGDVACKELRVFCKNKKPIQDEIADYAGESDGLVTSWLHLEDVLGPKGVASLMTGIPMA
ncbi:uncharacterized protein BO88DRAFT_423807 [Aspergillus vadensis CBS 113365]|uniref:DUF6604 domain-containing protein n=1 Tax=Aspergillus vadensis (strain CBS 113365 / IMI 142717 / IBT 24658) TaxID=1448311 RepID=A0A319BG11_ASPVC|nr:hypothetical protein BO88DRAFT_423807 [Aspergillus vadensis CBS 113365]PYH71004.1 hypothetical protein BO88DRAFT_423807 [Aspergillus vadensis CBS 113365]